MAPFILYLYDGETMFEKPGISVIIPTYNRAELLLRAVDSVQKQTYDNWELVIVDDGSKDETKESIKKLNDSRITYIKNEKNMGAAASRNRGVSAAKFDYIAFLDSDDVWRENKLEKQMAYMNKFPYFGMIYCPFLNHYLDGHELVVPNHQTGEREGWIQSTLLINNVIGTPTMLIKKDVFKENGGFDISLRALEDWDFALRVSWNTQIGFLPEILVDAYQTSGSISYDGGGYYEARCKIIALNLDYLQEIGMFDMLVMDLFKDAEQRGILEPVRNILMISIEKYHSKL